MNQEITYSSTLIEYLYSDKTILEISEQKKVWELIKQNYVVCDSDLKILEFYGEIIKGLPNSVLKQELQNFVDGLINDKAQKRIIFNTINSNNDLEMNLAKSSNDKIYFNPIFNEKEIKNIIKKHSEIEPHNVFSFLAPQPIQRLKHLPTVINMESGCYYDINRIIGPFLKDAKNIRIEDPYLPNGIASKNLWKLLDHVKMARVKLVFLKRNKYIHSNNKVKEKQYDSFIKNIIQYQSKGLLIDFSEPFIKKSHRERWIFTDDFQIYIPGGLDFLSEDGFYIKDTNYSQDVDYRNQIRIEKREFEVKFN